MTAPHFLGLAAGIGSKRLKAPFVRKGHIIIYGVLFLHSPPFAKRIHYSFVNAWLNGRTHKKHVCYLLSLDLVSPGEVLLPQIATSSWPIGGAVEIRHNYHLAELTFGKLRSRFGVPTGTNKSAQELTRRDRKTA